jgi:hypothetical protein
MSGVAEVRNTINTAPTHYTNVTAAVLKSSTKDHAKGIKWYLDGVATVDGLTGGTSYCFWVELLDARGKMAEPQPVGHVRIRQNVDTKLVDYGNNIVADGDMTIFNGPNSYTNFAEIAEAGVDYGEFVRSGTWSMTLWIKPLVDSFDERRFLSIKKEELGLIFLSHKPLCTFKNGVPLNLTKDAWYLFALSVDDHQRTIHTSANGSAFISTTLGEWNISSTESNMIFIGANDGWGT